MSLSKTQIITLCLFALGLLILMFGFRTKPNELLEREKTRSMNLQATNVTILKQEAVSLLSGDQKSRIQITEAQLSEATNVDQKADLHKQLSAVWYGANQLGIAGFHAEEVAKLLETGEAWSIAGTTYGLCIQRTEKDKEKKYCLEKSLQALENAISLDPEEVSYQLNRAVILTENPPAENPMQGVQLMLGLNKKFPKNVTITNNIAKFALQTNQLEKAEQRLLGALEIEPNNKRTNCLLAQLYSMKGMNDKASEYKKICEE